MASPWQGPQRRIGSCAGLPLGGPVRARGGVALARMGLPVLRSCALPSIPYRPA